MENTATVRSRTSEMKIGKTVYIVTTHYNENGRENAEEKLFRIVSDHISKELKNLENTTVYAVSGVAM